jgi:hypothetical protein
MGIISNGKITMIGNFEKPRRFKTKDGRPRNWTERDYKAIRPFDFKWRAKLAKVECTCTEYIEAYEPRYGFKCYHSDECAIMKHYRKHPQMQNFGADPSCFAVSE